MKAILLIYLLFFSCNTPEKYRVNGIVKEINYNENKLLIDHDDIPGFMVKMVMYFKTHESVDLNLISLNDSVSFDLVLNKNNSYTINYKILGNIVNNENDFWDDEKELKYSLKAPSDKFEDVTFLNLNSNEVKLSEITNQFSVISFIFSRCPMPNMCPAAIVKNQYLSNYFKDEDVKFLLISFDYLYDTPEVLNNIYGSLTSNNLMFLSSFNHVNDIQSLTKQSGLGFWGVEDNNIGHTMRTIVIDKDLRLLKTFDGLAWTAGEAKNSIEKLIKLHY